MSSSPELILKTLVAIVILSASAAGAALTLTLERALPVKGVDLGHLAARDRSRHRGRFLLNDSSALPPAGVIEFPVAGSADPFSVGLYYTRVKLGNPSKDFYVQIDTGSDVLWVSCTQCSGCPSSSGLNIQPEFFDPDKSSTSSRISCSDNICTSALQTGEALCSSSRSSSMCDYSFQYGDGSSTSGNYVSDTLYFDRVLASDQHVNSSATVVFGCSNSVSGALTRSDRAVDGIFGFGQNDLSIISQLSSQGVAPKVFSHCLKGSDNGGGILVLGEIVQPGIVYTPLVKSQPHYNLNLESIAVNGQKLSIDSSVFATTNTQGTIVDSGTTLAYLAEEAYNPFVNAIFRSVSSSVQPVTVKGTQCFATSRSVDQTFPSVTLNFMGGASMSLKPENYLLQQGYIGSSILWCIGWQNNQGSGITILGDIVLKDKVFVYNLAKQQIGWVDFDCSQSVNVSTGSGQNEYLNGGQLDIGKSSQKLFSNLLSTCILFALDCLFSIPFLWR